MAEQLNKPGPNESDSRQAVRDAIRDSDARVMTAKMIEEQVDYSLRTVHKRLDELEDELETQEVAGATTYWMPREGNVADGGVLGPRAYWADYELAKHIHGPVWVLELLAGIGMSLVSIAFIFAAVLSLTPILPSNWALPATIGAVATFALARVFGYLVGRAGEGNE